MHPNGEELLRGAQGTLTTYVLPEVQSAYARSEMMIVHVLLGMVANEWDGAAQRLVDGNATLRALARRVAETLGNAGAAGAENEGVGGARGLHALPSSRYTEPDQRLLRGAGVGTRRCARAGVR